MILTKNISFKNFSKNKKNKILKKNLYEIINNQNEILRSLNKDYKYSYSKSLIKKFKKKFLQIRLIAMGGSILGTKAIYRFLEHKIKKKVIFIDNLIPKLREKNKDNNNRTLNVIVSKSGNTLETILNANILLKKNQKNIFITQNDNNYLRIQAKKLKSEIVDHNNFIGGRYSVLSEVGMLPASLMGLAEHKFKQFNNLIKNKSFLNNLITNTSNIIFFLKRKKFNSVIINYDDTSKDFFNWYQQLVAESLGKNKKGIFPVVSSMPKDNHSLMQLYLDGPKNNFFTFFNVTEKKSDAINNHSILKSKKFLKNKKLFDILDAKMLASEKVFSKRKIPFRSFKILNRSEETLGELFTFFILETILIGKILKLNPYDQPAVEMIKKDTVKILKSF